MDILCHLFPFLFYGSKQGVNLQISHSDDARNHVLQKSNGQMKTMVIIFLLFLVVPSPCAFGQVEGDPIRLGKAFAGYKFYQNDHRLTIRQLRDAVAANKQAYTEIESARRTHVWMLILSGLGGAMIGNPIGTAMGGGDPDWSYALVGSGLVFVALVPLNNKFTREAKRGVDLYNSGLGADVPTSGGGAYQPRGLENINFSAGFGFLDLFNFGFRYQLEQVQLGLYMGSFPRASNLEVIRSFIGDVSYHFGGFSKLSSRRPWYGKIGLGYIGETGEYYIVLNTRIGREFNITDTFGISVDIGSGLLLGGYYDPLEEGAGVIPTFGLGFFVKP